MDKLEVTSHQIRRVRSRSLIQLGGLISRSGLLETFEINLGDDLQQNLEMKKPVASLYKGLLELNNMVQSGDFHIPLMAEQGLEALGKLKKKK